MTIFALDTSSKAASCALWRDDTLLGEFFLNIGLTHSQTVLPLADSLLRHTGLTMAQVDVFAVTTGPGSFTGLRIGIAAVKGMAMATDKPCAGVSTLESLAMNVSAYRGAILPVMDARRNQFYSGLFRCKGETLTQLEPDAPRDMAALTEMLNALSGQPVLLVGDGADRFRDLLSGMPEVIVGPRQLLHQRAGSVAVLAARMAREEQLCSADELMPEYLRLSQAEREKMARLER